jgi:glutaredoxin
VSPSNYGWKVVLLLLLQASLSSCSSRPAVDTALAPPSTPPGMVVVFTRSGCPYCAQALDCLQAAGITPLERDINQDAQAYQELLAIYRVHFPDSKVVVPLLGRDGRYFRGFHRQRLESWLSHAAPAAPLGDEAACD